MTRRRKDEARESTDADALAGLADIEHALGHTFATRQTLLDALTHRSYAYEFAGPGVVSNERLEFLGDAVLTLVAADLLFARFPTDDEGVLTQYRAALVQAATLARFGARLGLGVHLRLGRGEAATGGRTREPLLAAAFEAVVGALSLDGGLSVARAFLEPLLMGEIAQIEQSGGRGQIKDAKSLLQELAQAELGVTPRYEVVSAIGPSHERIFTVEVLLGEHSAGRGEGRSKQQSEQDAARHALADPGWRERAKENSLAAAEPATDRSSGSRQPDERPH